MAEKPPSETDLIPSKTSADAGQAKKRSTRVVPGRLSGGIGAMIDSDEQIRGGALTLDLDVYGTQTRFKKWWSIYGNYNIRLELGTGAGVSGHGLTGYAFTLDSPSSRRIGLQVGVEGLNYVYSANLDDGRVDFWEWLPALSLGIRTEPLGVCKVLLLARGGAAVGNLGTGGIRPMYGAGAYLSCGRLDMASSITRVLTETQTVELVETNLSARLGKVFGIGLRFESIHYRENGDVSLFESPEADRRNEYRSFLVARFFYASLGHRSH